MGEIEVGWGIELGDRVTATVGGTVSLGAVVVKSPREVGASEAGTAVGDEVIPIDLGASVKLCGARVGLDVGDNNPSDVGDKDVLADGDCVGVRVTEPVVGALDTGTAVGRCDGELEGSTVGSKVGAGEGATDGNRVGVGVA